MHADISGQWPEAMVLLGSCRARAAMAPWCSGPCGAQSQPRATHNCAVSFQIYMW